MMYGVTMVKVPKVISAFIAAAEEVGAALFKNVQAFCKNVGDHPGMHAIMFGLKLTVEQLSGKPAFEEARAPESRGHFLPTANLG